MNPHLIRELVDLMPMDEEFHADGSRLLRAVQANAMRACSG